jgi:hypothetical protein
MAFISYWVPQHHGIPLTSGKHSVLKQLALVPVGTDKQQTTTYVVPGQGTSLSTCQVSTRTPQPVTDRTSFNSRQKSLLVRM